MRLAITLLTILIGCCNTQPASSAVQEVNYVEAKHEIFGGQRIYFSKDFFRLDLEREGTTFVRKKSDKEPYIFNRKNKVYFRGDNSSAMKRAEMMAYVSGNGDATKDWSKFKWRLEGKDTICNTSCRRYSHKGKQLVKVWICEFPGVDNRLYQDHLEWSKSPNLGGLPLRMLVISYAKKGAEVPVVAFNTKKIGKIKMSMDELEIPKGSKRVTNIFELSSNRTSELMDEFSTILGD